MPQLMGPTDIVWYDALRTQHCFWSISAKMPNLSLLIRKHQTFCKTTSQTPQKFLKDNEIMEETFQVTKEI